MGDNKSAVEDCLCAIREQSEAASSRQFLLAAPAAQSTNQAAAAAAAAAATGLSAVAVAAAPAATADATAVRTAASDTVSAPTTQQQEQQQQHDVGPYLTVPVQLLQPLLLSLLQLCAELKPILSVLLISVMRIDQVVNAFWAALQSVPAAPSAPSTLSGDNLADQQQVLLLTLEAALDACTQPLLHQVGPVVLKTVQLVEQGLSRGEVSSSITAQLGETAEQRTASMAGKLLRAFAGVVLHL
jgi:hypothetical protein